MRAGSWCLALMLAALLLPLQAEASKKKTHHKKAEVVVAAEPVVQVQAPTDFTDAFHEAMRSRNREQVLAMFAPDMVVFETGYLQTTRDEYVKNNLSDDTDFASVTDYRTVSRGVIGSGQMVAVLTEANIQGIFGDQKVDLDQSETMILRRTKTGWEIVHLHWSAHPHQASDSEPEAQAVPPSVTPEPAATVPAAPATANDLKPTMQLTVPAVPESKPEDTKNP